LAPADEAPANAKAGDRKLQQFGGFSGSQAQAQAQAQSLSGGWGGSGSQAQGELRAATEVLLLNQPQSGWQGGLGKHCTP
jgi:hypothetical protein